MFNSYTPAAPDWEIPTLIIPTGLWSGSGPYTVTMNVSGVTEDTKIDCTMDDTINQLKSDLTVTTGAGTVTVSTAKIPAGEIHVTIIPKATKVGTVEHELVDVYSKAQTDANISDAVATMSLSIPQSADTLEKLYPYFARIPTYHTATLMIMSSNSVKPLTDGKVINNVRGIVSRLDATTFDFMVTIQSSTYDMNRIRTWRILDWSSATATPTFGTVYGYTGTAL